MDARDILCLQEVGLPRSQLESLLEKVSPEHWTVDWDKRHRCGALVIVGHQWVVTQRDSRGSNTSMARILMGRNACEDWQHECANLAWSKETILVLV